MTVQNLRSAKKHRCEDGNGLRNLQWVHIFFGLFHLRMAIMNLVYVLWRAPKSEDFAHLNAIIEKLHKHGFSNEKKITNFKATEDLLITTYKSYIVAWVVDQVQKEIPDWDNKNPQQRKDAAALILCARGTEWTEENIIEKCFNEMFSELTRVQDTQIDTREVFHQASELVSIIGLYIDFHDTIKKGKVGKITTLLRLLLPYFAGSSSHKYTKEIATFLSIERSCDPDTWMFILDNTLIKAKGPGFIEADCRMEHLIRVQKRYLENKAHDFDKMSADWSLVSGILDSARKALLISTSSQDKEVVNSRAIKSMAMDILSLSTAIIDDGVISNPNKQPDAPTVGLHRKGTSMLHDFDMREVYDGLFGQRTLPGDAQQGEYIVDTDTVDVVGVHGDDEDLLDNILNEVDVDPEPTPLLFNPILDRVRASGQLGIQISPR